MPTDISYSTKRNYSKPGKFNELVASREFSDVLRIYPHKRQNRYFVDYTKLQEHVPPDNDPLFIECRALSPTKGSIANARYLENLSRNRFGREREAVEEDIERHAKIVYATGERSSQGNYERKGTSWDSDFYD